MSTLAPPPPPPGIHPAAAPSNAAPGKWITGAQKPEPVRMIVNGAEGVGKTTIGAHAPGAAFLMARNETGYETLLGAGRVPECPRMLVNTWPELLATVRDVAKQPGDIQTLVLDALGGFERLCAEDVCYRDPYNGDWDKFNDYGRGWAAAQKDWLHLIAALDAVHAAGVGVILLSHITVKAFNNPEGATFDRYQADCNKTIWGLTHKWADTVLFFTFKQDLKKDKDKTKAIMSGGKDRYCYTTRSDAYDAKDRYGMPAAGFKIPDDPAQAWPTIAQYIPYYNQPKTTATAEIKKG